MKRSPQLPSHVPCPRTFPLIPAVFSPPALTRRRCFASTRLRALPSIFPFDQGSLVKRRPFFPSTRRRSFCHSLFPLCSQNFYPLFSGHSPRLGIAFVCPYKFFLLACLAVRSNGIFPYKDLRYWIRPLGDF